MLFIHGSLAMGGIETFFVRMAKQRAIEGKKNYFLLLSPEKRCDKELLSDARQYAEVYFLQDICALPTWITGYIPLHLALTLPLKSSTQALFRQVDHVHVANGICAHFFMYLSRVLPANVKFTLGLYHSLEYCWGDTKLPYYERANREFFFNELNKQSVYFFNESMVPLYESVSKQSFQAVNLFPLGVVERKTIAEPLKKAQDKTLRLVSVGRLVPFKTYNFHMLDVVADLMRKGVSITYDIYGDGPCEMQLQEKITSLSLDKVVCLKGRLNYSKFADVVSCYDIFIGSGTAIVEASSLGTCSIVGIEHVEHAVSYGFFADLPGFSYNEDGLYPKQPIAKFIEHYLSLSPEDLRQFKAKHMEKAALFSLEQCVHNFEKSPRLCVPVQVSKARSKLLFRLKYSLSLFLASLLFKMRDSSLSQQVVQTQVKRQIC